MLLVIDVGNTNSVFGIYDGEKLLTHWRLTSAANRTIDESWITIKLLCQEGGVEPDALTRVIISSVVPNITDVMGKMSGKYLGIDPVVVGPDLPIDLDIRYRNPREVGADRICNAMAGKHLYNLPQVIIDFGTATTFDILDSSGAYLGGIIMPGFEVASRDLFHRAARLFKVEYHFPEQVIGETAETSMQSGIMYGTVDAVNGLLERIKGEMKTDSLDVIVTGGNSELMVPHIYGVTDTNPDLTLEGLRLISQQLNG